MQLRTMTIASPSWPGDEVTAPSSTTLAFATDPVAVISLMREVGAPKRLSVLMEGESLLNDGVAVVVFGVVLNRLNVSWIGLLPYTGNIYVPSWMELTITATIVIAGVVVFGLAARFLPVYPPEENTETAID